MNQEEQRRLKINPKTHHRSVKLRRDVTGPEQVLWSAIRNRQLNGLKFRRQHPIEPFIVDFCCMETRRAIKIDGESHDGRQSYDADRQRKIESQGYHVLRFTNDDVLENLDGVLLAIIAAIGGDAHPPLTPP